MLHKVEPSSTFCNNFFQLETMLAFKQMRIILFQTGIFFMFLQDLFMQLECLSRIKSYKSSNFVMLDW